ncbi:putative tRNA threonylcarbamoyladenosine biosynthesis protein YwlC [uncultured Alphaproteobacteria bacterium]|uniref:Threonylcarbamoyl-AMP synthase n=1 Tax=uncultured Alphaproteobacteria bacterium TaxID=91750 RepID=A0A212KIR4_9PROT|nr:putative tRNA threonylcarbamoyladenosine biosynthesis protein YwlC [uncultured Alphaproteobacteria bacterium]
MTEVLGADPESCRRAGEALAAGRLVAFPTETVYGLGGDARNGEAVAAIFAAKGRPSFNPLIVHVTDLAAAERLGAFSEAARALAARFWPGPLTLVLPRRADAGVSDLVSAGLPSLAIRMPAHPVARAVLAAAGCPVAAPSANPSGRVSPTTAQHVRAGLDGRVDLIVDGGRCAVGVESTVLDLTGEIPTILRPGGVTPEDVAAVTGGPVGRAATPHAPSPDAPLPSPGMLASHYAPATPVRLEAERAEPGEALLGFGPAAGATLNLSPAGDLREAAANLFAMLRQLDEEGYRVIAVSPIPDRGLGLAINDRLKRAAAPRGD